MNKNNFELLYHFEQLENNSRLDFRIPQALKDEFIQYAGKKGYSRVLREFMINYIAERRKEKE